MHEKLKNSIKQVIKEELDIDAIMLSGEDGGLKAYAKKVEEFLEEFHNKADALATEGEELVKENYLKVPAAEERKRTVLTLVGYMRQVRNVISSATLRIRFLIG